MIRGQYIHTQTHTHAAANVNPDSSALTTAALAYSPGVLKARMRTNEAPRRADNDLHLPAAHAEGSAALHHLQPP